MSVGVNTAKFINNGNQINLLIMLKFVKKQHPKYAYVVNRRFLIPDSKKKTICNHLCSKFANSSPSKYG